MQVFFNLVLFLVEIGFSFAIYNRTYKGDGLLYYVTAFLIVVLALPMLFAWGR